MYTCCVQVSLRLWDDFRNDVNKFDYGLSILLKIDFSQRFYWMGGGVGRWWWEVAMLVVQTRTTNEECFVIHQHGRHDVTCKPVIRWYWDTFTCSSKIATLTFASKSGFSFCTHSSIVTRIWMTFRRVWNNNLFYQFKAWFRNKYQYISTITKIRTKFHK